VTTDPVRILLNAPMPITRDLSKDTNEIVNEETLFIAVPI
jgi:hypothetical protein